MNRTELIILVLIVLGIIITVIIYFRSSDEEQDEKRLSLLYKFENIKFINAQLIQDLTNYAEKNNAFDERFMQDLSFKDGIAGLVKAKKDFFTSRNFTELQSKRLSRRRIEYFTRNTEEQVNFHTKVQAVFNDHHKSLA